MQGSRYVLESGQCLVRFEAWITRIFLMRYHGPRKQRGRKRPFSVVDSCACQIGCRREHTLREPLTYARKGHHECRHFPAFTLLLQRFPVKFLKQLSAYRKTRLLVDTLLPRVRLMCSNRPAELIPRWVIKISESAFATHLLVFVLGLDHQPSQAR